MEQNPINKCECKKQKHESWSLRPLSQVHQGRTPLSPHMRPVHEILILQCYPHLGCLGSNWKVTKIEESTFQASNLTVTSLTPKGRLNSPWRNPFFSKNWTICLLGRRTVEARRDPDGFHAKLCSSLKHLRLPQLQWVFKIPTSMDFRHSIAVQFSNSLDFRYMFFHNVPAIQTQKFGFQTHVFSKCVCNPNTKAWVSDKIGFQTFTAQWMSEFRMSKIRTDAS